ncbi:TIGR03943 family protein [Nocardiopsis exhalans]|uniref:TIGR03943 family protein n=2 Tax=Nocardiopsis TaxID=2013 RepID=A0ABY5D387_9ACTN|nr:MULTISPECIES: TIGR03943 family protein [Nocardiopsis]MBB5491076.1 putative repeat protein (TIGR03943 family) [Nocardiopsis metallicus]USY17652.1 TIGR03943 family protein [Nocardiopsis exhalans]
MNRIAQGLTLVLLGAAALTATIPTDLYLNWVKGAFGPFLIAAGVVMVVLGALVITAEVRGEGQALDEEPAVPEDAAEEHRTVAASVEAHEPHEGGSDRSELDRAAAEYGGGSGHDHGHDHSRAPRVAWLLLLPVVAVFVIAPPALGSYTVESTGGSSGPPPRDDRASSRFSDNLTDAAPGDVVELDIQQFVLRAWVDENREMAGREVELTGFAVPVQDGEGWYLARLQMACCAADAVVNKILITDHPAPEADTWWQVRGTWVEPEGDLYEVAQHEMETLSVTEVTNPPEPYE